MDAAQRLSLLFSFLHKQPISMFFTIYELVTRFVSIAHSIVFQPLFSQPLQSPLKTSHLNRSISGESNAVIDQNCVETSIHDLTADLLGSILIRSGKWKAAGTTLGAWSVCREWRDCVRNSPTRLSNLLIDVNGAGNALMRVAKCRSPAVDTCAVVRQLLNFVTADYQGGSALVTAVTCGNQALVRMLLEWPVHAPPADCQDGQALCYAAFGGSEAVVRMLLDWPENAPRADCQDGEALCNAAGKGHETVVRILLDWPEHAPRANCGDGRVLCWAALCGHTAVVRMLLDWPAHAPRADCQDGQALCNAAGQGEEDVVRMLLECRKHAPRANCMGGQALCDAAEGGHERVVRMLLEWPKHAPRADCMGGEALRQAAAHPAVLKLLQNHVAA